MNSGLVIFLAFRSDVFRKYKTFSVLIYSYINTSGIGKTRNCVKTRRPNGRVFSLNFDFFPISTSCNSCKMQRLLPNYFKRPLLKFSKECTCIKNVYINPTQDKIPDLLKGKTEQL